MNIVQDFALELLMMWDSRDASEKEAEHFKRMLGASHPNMMRTLWPEWFANKPKDSSDSSTSGWVHEKSIDKNEGMKLLEQLRKQKMTANLADLDDESNWM